MELVPGATTLYLRETMNSTLVHVHIQPSNTTDTISFSKSNNNVSVSFVDDIVGGITGKSYVIGAQAIGSTVVTFTCGSISKSITITVK
jgi:hypothetical protein